MKLGVKRRIAADVLGVGENRVWFDSERLEDIKQAITKEDMRSLIREGAVKAKKINGQSRVRTRKIRIQKSKGRRKGIGSRKGRFGARIPRKEMWITAIRCQRQFIRLLRDKGYVGVSTYRVLKKKAKGGLFRSKRHIKLYLEDRGLLEKK